MPLAPPRFGRKAAPRKAWTKPRWQPDRRKRGRAGQRDRAQVLAEEPLCRPCLEVGLTSPSEEVDHVVPLFEGGSDDRSNKQGICRPCHKKKTAAESLRARSGPAPA